MEPLTEQQVRRSFINCSRGEAAGLTLPRGFASLAWDDIELLGSTGGARLFVENYATDDTLRLYADLEGEPVTITPTVHVPAGHHQAVIEEFLATIRSGEWSTSFGDYALHRSRVLDAVYESAREGREVSVA